MATSRVLEMDFSTELNQTHRMRVYDAKTTLTGAEITTARPMLMIWSPLRSGSGSVLDGEKC